MVKEIMRKGVQMVKQILKKIEKDKLLHFIAGVLIYQSTVWFVGYYAIIPVVICAICKEVYDRYYGGTVDVYDTVATILGGIVCLG